MDSSNPLVLSERDVERLINEETPDARIGVLKKVAHGHVQQRYSLSELAVAEQIFRVLIRDTEVTVRESLAESLKDNPHVPRDIILALTRDIESVATPIIEHSVLLTDADLLALIQSAKNSTKQVAVARRKQVSEEVALSLIGTQNPRAVLQLVKNPGARVPEEGFQQIVQSQEKNGDIMAAIAMRPNLPVTVVEKIITLVSDSLADRLRNEYHIAPTTIAIETEKTRELSTLRLMDGPIDLRDVEKLVDQLQVFGRLTPSIILTSLCRGNLYFFETALARLSSIPVRNAQLLIHDKGELGFKALYNKAGLPDKFFAACRLLLEVVADIQRAGQKRDSGTLAQKLLAKCAGRNIDNLAYILALIRQSA